MSLVEKAKELIFNRQNAYKKVFDLENVFTDQVLADLAKFCRAEDSCFHENDRVHAVIEGRREVWIRIHRHLTLNHEQLWEKYRRKDPE